MRLKRSLALLTLSAVTASCSSNSDSSSSTSSGNAVFNNAVTTVTSKMNAVDTLLPDNAGASSIQGFVSNDRVHTTAAFGTAWDGSGSEVLSNPRCSGGSSTICSTPVHPKEWMGYQLDPSAVRENGSAINVFGRFDSAMRIGCAVMNLVTVDSSTGYPTDGSHTITFTSTSQEIMTSKCGFDSDEVSGMTGLSISLTVTTPSDTTYYDKKIVFTLPTEMSGGTQNFYMRVNSSAINILTSETNSNGINRTIVALDRTNDVLRVEYFSGGSTTSGGFNFYRLYYDATNDQGRLFGYESDASDSGGIRYTLSGKPSTGAEAALSMDLKGWGSGGSWDKNYKACVTMSTGAIATDDSLSCAGSVTGTDIDDASLATVYNNAFTNRANTGWIDNADETTSLTYNATTIFSAAATY